MSMLCSVFPHTFWLWLQFTVELCVPCLAVVFFTETVQIFQPFMFLPLSTYISSTIFSRSRRLLPAMPSTHSTASCRAYPITSTLLSSPSKRCWSTWYSLLNMLVSHLRSNSIAIYDYTNIAAYFTMLLSFNLDLNYYLTNFDNMCIKAMNSQKVHYKRDVKCFLNDIGGIYNTGGLPLTFCLCQHLDHFHTRWRLPHPWAPDMFDQRCCSPRRPSPLLQLQLRTIFHPLGPSRGLLPTPLSPAAEQAAWPHS